MKFWLTTYLTFLYFALFGQMLDNSDGFAFTDQPFFNASFIQANKIDTVRGKYIIRKPGKSFKRTEYFQEFTFDKRGRLLSQIETFPEDGTTDSTATHYDYDDLGRLRSIQRKTREGYVVEDFKYDSVGRLIEETVSKLYVDSKGETRSTQLNSESYKYIDLETQWRRVSYNSYGKPFLEEIFYEDENGYLTKKKDVLKMTSKKVFHEYEYDDNGYLSAVRKKADKAEGYMEEVLFSYDEFGNLSEKQIYNNGEHITDIQIIYNNKTGLLSSIVTRSIPTGILAILQFKEYSYFEM